MAVRAEAKTRHFYVLLKWVSIYLIEIELPMRWWSGGPVMNEVLRGDRRWKVKLTKNLRRFAEVT